MSHPAWRALAPLLLLACNAPDPDDDGQKDTDQPPDPGPALAGAWESTDDPDGSPLDGSGVGRVQWIEFEPGSEDGAGTLHIYGEDEVSGALGCPTALYARGTGGALVVSSGRVYNGSRVMLLEFIDEDTLELRDETGLTQRFERGDSVPSSDVCNAIDVVNEWPVDLLVSSWSNLVWNGTDLLVPDDNGGFFPLDLDEGTLGTAIGFGTTYEQLVTMQGADGWGHCACGGSEEAVRTSAGGAEVDTIDTDDLGTTIGVRTGAWTGEHLLLGGYSHDDSTNYILEIDSDEEPDVLVTAHVDLVRPSAMTWHDGALMGLSGTRIFQIDLPTGRADETWSLPAAYLGISWRGIASSGDGLFLLGRPEGPGAVVVEVELQ